MINYLPLRLLNSLYTVIANLLLSSSIADPIINVLKLNTNEEIIVFGVLQVLPRSFEYIIFRKEVTQPPLNKAKTNHNFSLRIYNWIT